MYTPEVPRKYKKENELNAVFKKVLPYIIGLGVACLLFGSGYLTGSKSTGKNSDDLRRLANQYHAELNSCRSELVNTQTSLARSETELDSGAAHVIAGESGVESSIIGLGKVQEGFDGDIELIDDSSIKVRSALNEVRRLSNGSK